MRAVAPRAQGADPKTAHSFRYPFSIWYAIAVFIGMFWDFAVTSVIKVLTQTFFFLKSWTRLLLLCDCSHKSAFVSAPGADDPCPRTTGRGRNPDYLPGAYLEAYHRPNRRCASVDATPSIIHPSSEDMEGSTSAVP